MGEKKTNPAEAFACDKSEYELLREARMRANAMFMHGLGLETSSLVCIPHSCVLEP